MRQVFLDTETTGVEIGACIVEIAAIMVEDNEIIDTFHEYCKPYREININAYKAHGISMEMVKNKPAEKEILQRFIEWMIGLGDADEVLAYNAQFDIRIINDRMKMDNIVSNNYFDDYKIVDVAKIAKDCIRRGIIPKDGRKWNQEYVAKCLGINYNAHSALEDTKAMMKIYNILKDY